MLREDVHHDGLVRADRPGADLVRIRGLLPRSDDRPFGQAAALEERALDDRAHPLDRERGTVERQCAARSDVGARDGVDAELPGLLRRALRRLDRRDLVLALRAAPLLEPVGEHELEALGSQPLGEAEREPRRDAEAPCVVRGEEPLDHGRGRVRDRMQCGLELARPVGVDVLDGRRARRLAGAALLERVREQHDLAIALNDGLRIGREEPEQVIDVGVPVGVAEEEERRLGVGHRRTLAR